AGDAFDAVTGEDVALGECAHLAVIPRASGGARRESGIHVRHDSEAQSSSSNGEPVRVGLGSRAHAVRPYPKRLMGLEPTTFCMAIRSWVFGRSKRALQIATVRCPAITEDPRGSSKPLANRLAPRVNARAGKTWVRSFESPPWG